MATKKSWKRPQLARSEVIEELPIACSNETAAVEFLERKRWGDCPCCCECGSVDVYKMRDSKTGERNKRFMWRCKDCKKQFTVRAGTVLAESLVPLHKWCRAMWMTASGKNGVSALELQRALQVNYRTALFMLHRLRHAMEDTDPNPPKMEGIVEVDETYCGGKPRYKKFQGSTYKPNKAGRGTRKTPVLAVIERGGDVRTRVVARVTADNIKAILQDNVKPGSVIITDQFKAYRRVAQEHGPHFTVQHNINQYVDPRNPLVHTNTIEGFFSRVKRGLNGVYHSVSKEHLHRYITHFAYMHNTRAMTDGDRTLDLIQKIQGKRLMYRDPVIRKTA